jgi:hypothetical protein
MHFFENLELLQNLEVILKKIHVNHKTHLKTSIF